RSSVLTERVPRAYRHHQYLSRLLRAPGPFPDRQGATLRAARHPGPRPAYLDTRPTQHRRRHPLRRWARPGHETGTVGRGTRHGRRRSPRPPRSTHTQRPPGPAGRRGTAGRRKTPRLRLWTLRGHRLPGRGGSRGTHAGGRTQYRRLRPQRRGVGDPGHGRGDHPTVARCPGQQAVPRPGLLRLRWHGTPRGRAGLHQTRRVAWTTGAPRSAVGKPRGGGPLAARPGAAQDSAQPPRTVGSRPRGSFRRTGSQDPHRTAGLTSTVRSARWRTYGKLDGFPLGDQWHPHAGGRTSASVFGHSGGPTVSVPYQGLARAFFSNLLGD